jgi:hypothetical protein
VKKKTLDTALTPEAIEASLGEIETKLGRLRGTYESFFMGIERQPPHALRRECNRLILDLQQQVINRASLRFRFQSVITRWVMFTTYWNRTLREMESGTYRRDLARAYRHLAERRGRPLKESEAVAMGIPVSRAKAFVAQQNRRSAVAAPPQNEAGPTESAVLPPPEANKPVAAQPVASKPQKQDTPAAPASAPITGVNTKDIEQLYSRYLEARRQAQDPRPALTMDTLQARLGVQVPKILASQKCSRVNLGVTIEDGKVRLKAWPAE